MTTNPSTPSEGAKKLVTTWWCNPSYQDDLIELALAIDAHTTRVVDACRTDWNKRVLEQKADLAAIKSANDRTHHACVDAAKSYPGIHGESFSPNEAIAWYEEQLARKEKIIAALKESRKAWKYAAKLKDIPPGKASEKNAVAADAALRELGVYI